jgi:hypothetical protein
MLLRHVIFILIIIIIIIVTGYGLDGREIGILFQTASGTHPTSYEMGTGGSFPGVK